MKKFLLILLISILLIQEFMEVESVISGSSTSNSNSLSDQEDATSHINEDIDIDSKRRDCVKKCKKKCRNKSEGRRKCRRACRKCCKRNKKC
ncbi:uncharacterized protein PF07_0086-like isoform X1 [Salvia splendens]|uniref:uncharacterized protein PF07_0086-like isoform X1 n=1 Tax=Salvia splendens TaxID=180675 RepID=UPI001C27004B|nr:uncharacterized protein PF07_0086-like isoform X1 [Salvia splendens]